MRLRRRPPALWSIALAVAVTGIVVEDASRQVAMAPFVGLAALASACILLAHYVSCWLRAPQPNARAEQWRWAALPLATALCVAAWWKPWPLYLRFEHSRAAFESALAAAASSNFAGPTRIGTFRVSRTAMAHGATYFIVGDSVADPVAICFDPTPTTANWLNVPLGGNWYAREM